MIVKFVFEIKIHKITEFSKLNYYKVTNEPSEKIVCIVLMNEFDVST